MRTSATGRKAKTGASAPGRSAGFTVIELMLVLSVLVVCASVVLPSYPGYVRGQRLRATAGRLAATVRSAAEWSVIHERPLTLSYDDGERAFALSIEDADSLAALVARPAPKVTATDDAEEIAPEPEAAWARLRLPEDVSFEAQEISQEVSSDSTQMRFLPDGRCDDAVFVLSAGEQRMSVRVEGSHARVRVEEGDLLEAGPQGGLGVAR